MSSLLNNQKTILEQLQSGEFIKGMEDYYAPDAVNEEPNGTKIAGGLLTTVGVILFIVALVAAGSNPGLAAAAAILAVTTLTMGLRLLGVNVNG